MNCIQILVGEHAPPIMHLWAHAFVVFFLGLVKWIHAHTFNESTESASELTVLPVWTVLGLGDLSGPTLNLMWT